MWATWQAVEVSGRFSASVRIAVRSVGVGGVRWCTVSGDTPQRGDGKRDHYFTPLGAERSSSWDLALNPAE